MLAGHGAVRSPTNTPAWEAPSQAPRNLIDLQTEALSAEGTREAVVKRENGIKSCFEKVLPILIEKLPPISLPLPGEILFVYS